MGISTASRGIQTQAFRPHLTLLGRQAPCTRGQQDPRAALPARPLTDADIFIVQLGGAVAVEAQAAVLAVLAPRVVFAADAGHHVEEVDVAAAVGVAVALAVWAGRA